MSATNSSKSVFVGNLPYDATEEQLTTLMSEVGPVINVRIVHDQDTGKPKGYAFCEYADAATALSAMRNLNGREWHGRTLRVDRAEVADARLEESHLVGRLAADTTAVLEQVMLLTEEQIRILPPTERDQIMRLRETMKHDHSRQKRPRDDDDDIQLPPPPPAKRAKQDDRTERVRHIKEFLVRARAALGPDGQAPLVGPELQGKPLDDDCVAELKAWAQNHGYFLHYIPHVPQIQLFW